MDKRSEDSQVLEQTFKCKQCDFKAPRNIEKHMNTKHVKSSFSESISLTGMDSPEKKPVIWRK